MIGLPRTARIVAVVAAAVALAVAPAHAAFPQDPPNDPGYGNGQGENCVNGEQYDLWDFMPECAPLARDPENAAGMSVNRVWRDYTTGDHEVVIGYVEAGINWHDEDIEELTNKVYLSDGELPPPTTEDGDPALQASDYADTADANGNGHVDAEDVIARFSDGRDDDRNGYVDDISGWDFYNDQNDPATVDSAYGHANGQMIRAAAQTDNGVGRAGICPRCRLLPVKAGAEALDRTDDLARAWQYAADQGATVIISVTADVGYSTLMRRTAEALHRRGVVVVEASNDFNSTDHQGGMYHPHVLPGNGIVADTAGLQQGGRATRTFRERSSITSWGTHNVFSVPTSNGTTSSSTPTIGGLVALIASYGRKAAAEGKIDRPLTGPEVVQVLRATASDINDPSLGWPNKEGWDLQFGYGRPNAARAAEAIAGGNIPPLAAIDTPDWYELADPTKRGRVDVRGRVHAPRSRAFRWELQMGLGAEPDDGDFRVVGRGRGSRPFDGRLGRVDLRDVPRSFWAKRFELSRRKELETTEQYTVTLRLRVTDAQGRTGEDRRSFFVHRDDDAVDPFPKRIGAAGGESQPALVDLQGRGRLAIVFGDTDGLVHAWDSRTGRELRGFPVSTRANRFTRKPRGVPGGSEPITSNVAVGDLDGNGKQWIVAATTTGSVYAWDSRGRRRAGFPKRLAAGVAKPPVPRPKKPYTRDPAVGSFAAPVLGNIDGRRGLEIVQAAWDGHLHVFGRGGRELPGWPVKVVLPDGYESPQGQFLVNDHKLQGTPALADLDGDDRLEIVQRSQFTDISGPDLSPGARGHLHAYRADGSVVPGWPVNMQATAEAYGTAQEFITEGSNSPIAVDADGNGDDEVISNPIFTGSYLFDGDGSQLRQYNSVDGGSPAGAGGNPGGGLTDAIGNVLGALNGAGPSSGAAQSPADLVVGFTTTGAVGRFAGGLSFAQPGTGAATIAETIATPGLGTQIKNYERAFDVASGEQRPGFPAGLQGLNFLGAPLFVDVTGDGQAEIVDGGDSSALHAFTDGGGQAPGFPKFHTGWNLWSPSAGDLDGDGRTELVVATREGYMFVWRTPGRADANGEWWRWHHDERSSGRYGYDTRPPGAIRGVRLARNRRTVSWLAPGGDWYTGAADKYVITAKTRAGRRGGFRAVTAPKPAESGRRQSVRLPRNTRCVRIQAIDPAGNRSIRKTAGRCF